MIEPQAHLQRIAASYAAISRLGHARAGPLAARDDVLLALRRFPAAERLNPDDYTSVRTAASVLSIPPSALQQHLLAPQR